MISNKNIFRIDEGTITWRSLLHFVIKMKNVETSYSWVISFSQDETNANSFCFLQFNCQILVFFLFFFFVFILFWSPLSTVLTMMCYDWFCSVDLANVFTLVHRLSLTRKSIRRFSVLCRRIILGGRYWWWCLFSWFFLLMYRCVRIKMFAQRFSLSLWVVIFFSSQRHPILFSSFLYNGEMLAIPVSSLCTAIRKRPHSSKEHSRVIIYRKQTSLCRPILFFRHFLLLFLFLLDLFVEIVRKRASIDIS